MSVPEAPIDKHHDALLWEDEIWFAEQARVPTPSGDPRGAKNLY